MNVMLWIAQGLLAVVFLGSAYFKGTRSREWLMSSGQTGVQGLPVPLIRFIALSELLGAIGLIAPWWTGIAAWLTPLAAVGLAVIMVLAAIVHARLGEPGNVATNIVLLLTCGFVAIGRSHEL